MELQAVPDDAPLHYSVIRDWEEPRCDGKLLKVVTPTDEMTGSFATIIFWAVDPTSCSSLGIPQFQ